MSFTQNIFSFAANRMGTKTLLSYSGKLVIHPFYHTVSDEYLPHITQLYIPKTYNEFEKDIAFIQRYFQAVSIEDVHFQGKEKKAVNKNSFHLSFDDGLREVYEVALPLLYSKGIPATIFVNKDFVDNKNLFFRHKAALIIDVLNRKNISTATEKAIRTVLATIFPQEKNLTTQILAVKYAEQKILDDISAILEIDYNSYLKDKRPYLTSDELKEMQKKGFTIGAHSIDHPRFMEISEEEQFRQIIESCSFVKAMFNEKYTYFAFPFSDEGVRITLFSDICKQIDLSFGISGIKTRYEGKHLDRIDMETYGKDAKQAINKALLKHLIRK